MLEASRSPISGWPFSFVSRAEDCIPANVAQLSYAAPQNRHSVRARKAVKLRKTEPAEMHAWLKHFEESLWTAELF